MSIRFQCACGKSYKVDDKYAGKRSKCSACGAVVTIPKVEKSGADSTFELASEPPAPPTPPSPVPPVPPLSVQADESATKVVPVPTPPKPGDLSLEVEPELPRQAKPELPSQGDLSLEEPPAKPTLKDDAEPPVLSEAPPVQVAPAGGEDIPLAEPQAPAPAAAAAEKKCPKCGAAADPSAAICIECGASFAPTGKPAVRKEPGIAGFVKRNAAVIAIVAVGLALLGGFIFGVSRLMKSKRPKQAPAANAGPAAAPGAPGAPQAPQPGAPGTPERAPHPGPGMPPGAGGPPSQAAPETPKAVARVEWTGFRDPRLVARDKLSAAGAALLAAMAQSGKPPATAVEAGLTADAQNGISYVGPEVAGLSRFRPLLYETAESAGKRYVFFSDGSTRLLAGSEWTAALPVKTAQGYLTPADQDLLAATAPRLRISNERYASLDALLDGAKVAAVPRGESRSLTLTEGAHELKLTAPDGRSETLSLNASRGLDCAYLLPLHVDTIFIPTRVYRSMLAQQGANLGYTAEKDGNTLIALKGAAERVVFSTPGARGALSQDLRTLEARIERDYGTIEGIDGKTLRIDELSRLEEGVVTFKSGAQATYRRTALGTLAVVISPNLAAASAARVNVASSTTAGMPADTMRGAGGMPPGGMTPPRMPPGAGRPGTIPSSLPPGRMDARPGATGMPALPGAPRPGGMPSGIEGMFAQQSGAQELRYPLERFAAAPDMASLAPVFNGGAVARLILTRALNLQKDAARAPGAEGAPGATGMAGMNEPVPGGRPAAAGLPGSMGAPRAGTPGMPGPGPGGSDRSNQILSILGMTPAQEEIARASSQGALFAGLALYGGPDSFAAMLPLAERLPAGSPGANEMMLALARCGQGASLAQLAAASRDSPVAAAIALSMIDDEAARKACGTVMADWTASRVEEAVNAWPEIAGPTARSNFVLSLAAARPELLDDLSALNALMKLDLHSLQAAMVKRLPDPQKPAEQAKSTASSAGGAPRKDRTGQTNVDESAPPPAWLILAHMKNSQAVSRLIALLYGQDAKAKQQALAALAEASDDSLVAPLGAQLADGDTAVRLAAARALARLGSAEAVALLTEKMTAELVTEDIVRAVPAMSKRAGRPATGRLLVGMLKQVVVRQQAPAGADAAAPDRPAGMPPGAPPMPPGAGRPAADLRPGRPAADARPGRLTTFQPGMGGSEAVQAEPVAKLLLDALITVGVPPDAKPALEDAARDADPAVRLAAHRALAGVGGGNLWRGVGKMIGLHGPTRASVSVDAVSPMVKDDSPLVRAGAIQMLGGGASAAVCDALLASAKDSDPGVRLAAMRAAGRLSGSSPKLNDVFLAGLADADPGVVAAAAEAVVEKKASSLCPAIVAAMNRPMQEGNEESQARALTALARAAARLKAPDATGALVLLLAHNRADVKTAAAEALGALHDAAAVPSLVSASRSEEAGVSGAAVIALSSFDQSGAAQAILAALQKDALPDDARRTVLLRVVAAAGKTGPFAEWVASGQIGAANMTALVSIAGGAPEQLRPGLIAIARRGLQDQRAEVRLPAAMILGAFKSDPAVRTAVLAALDQDASGVSALAADILRQNKDAAFLTNQLIMRFYKQLVDLAPSAAATPGGAGVEGGAAAGARSSGLARASAEENMMLRQAVIDSVFNCLSGDEAARALRNLVAMESDPVMRRRLIDAMVQTGSSQAVGYVADMAARSGPSVAQYAVTTLARIGSLNRAVAEEALQRMARASATDPELAAAAQDALEAMAAG